MELNHKILKTKFLNATDKQVCVQLYRPRGLKFNKNELQKVLTLFEQRGKERYDNYQIQFIKALNGDKYTTFHDMDGIEDYYRGKVKDTYKFMYFSQIEITYACSSPKK